MTLAQQYLYDYCVDLFDLICKYRNEDSNKPQVVRRDMISTYIRKATAQVGTGRGRGKSTAMFISADALAQIENGDATNIVYEHIVPVSVLTARILKKINDWGSPEELAEFIATSSMTALITKDEDDRLSDAGFRKSMPSDDPFSRYTHSSVNVTLIQRTEEMVDKQKAFLK